MYIYLAIFELAVFTHPQFLQIRTTLFQNGSHVILCNNACEYYCVMNRERHTIQLSCALQEDFSLILSHLDFLHRIRWTSNSVLLMLSKDHTLHTHHVFATLFRAVRIQCLDCKKW